MRLCVLPMPYAPVATSVLCYGAGSAVEREGTRGCSHLVEHLMFKGTKRFPSGAFWRIITRSGGLANAFTTRDVTAYYEVVPAARLREVLELEADRMASLEVDDAEVAREASIILEERRMSCQDSPVGALEEALLMRAFPDHPYGNPVIGFGEDIRSFTAAAAAEFHRTHCNPANAVLAVAGRVDPAEVGELVLDLFGGIPAGGSFSPPPDERPWGPPGRERLSHPSDLHRICIAFPSPEGTHPDWPILEMASTWLSGTRSSRLDELLVHGGLALDVSTGGSLSICPSLFTVRATVYPGRDPSVVEAIVHEELARLSRDILSERDFEDLRTQHHGLSVLSAANPAGAASELALSLSRFGIPSHQAASWEAMSRAVPQDLASVCTRWLDPSRAITMILEPSGSKPATLVPSILPRGEDISPPDDLDLTTAEIPPELTQPPSVSVSEGARTRTLPNGMLLVTRHDDTFPLVSVAFSTPLSEEREPLDRAGLAAVTAETMQHGTGDLGYIDFHRRLERLGSDLSFSAGTEHSTGIITILSDHIATGLEAVADLLRRPALGQDDLSRVVAEKIAEIRQRNESPFVVALEKLQLSMSDPPETARIPDEASLGSITRGDVEDFHRACSRPGGTVLVVVGNFSDRELETQIERLFGDWQDPAEALPPVVHSRVPERGACTTTSLEGKAQSYMLLACQAPGRSSSGFEAFRLLTGILGDDMGSRLERSLRTSGGLAYQVGCEHLATGGRGRLFAYLATSAENALEGIRRLQAELDSISTKAVGRHELDLAKASAMGRQALSLMDYDSLAGYLLRMAATGRPLDHDVRSLAEKAAVREEDILEAAAGWLGRERRFVSIAGAVPSGLDCGG